MKQCLNCKSMIDDDALFCPECGTKIGNTKTCINCGKEIDADSAFCPNCGASQVGRNKDEIKDKPYQTSSFKQTKEENPDNIIPNGNPTERQVLTHKWRYLPIALCVIVFCILGTIVGWYLYRNIQQKNTERDLLEIRFDSISRINDRNARELSEVNNIVNIISEELDSISIMEDMIRINPLGNEGRKPTQVEMRQRLKTFSEMLSRQKQRIALLEDSLSSVNNKTIQRYRSLVTLLNNQLEEKDRTISSLMTRLNNNNMRISELETNIAELTSANEELSNIAESQKEALNDQANIINEVYVRIGSKKELQDAGLLGKSSLLSKAKVNTSGFEPRLFQKVDIREFSEITIPAKSFTILTSMPESSYRIEKVGDSCILRIIDSARFWSISRYLIIQTK